LVLLPTKSFLSIFYILIFGVFGQQNLEENILIFGDFGQQNLKENQNFNLKVLMKFSIQFFKIDNVNRYCSFVIKIFSDKYKAGLFNLKYNYEKIIILRI